MEVKLDNRNTLIKVIESMNDMDVRQMLAYAAGYEAGKISQPVIFKTEQLRASPAQEVV